jgi:hypothetical protein
MKKMILIYALLLATSIVCSAQFFIEGDLGASVSNHKVEYGGVESDSNSNFNLFFSPRIGYWLNDRMAIGINITYSGAPKYSSLRVSPPEDYGLIIKTEGKSYEWKGSIFGRYKLFRMDKLSVLAECSMGINGGFSKIRSESITKTRESSTSFGINVFPVVSYNLTDRISIIAICDFMRFGFISGTTKNYDTDMSIISSYFGFNTGSTFFHSLNNIKAGFSYKF